MNEQRQGRQICGYSFWGQPIFYEKVGTGDTCLLFAGDFSSNAQCEGVLERFLRDLTNCGKKDLAPVGRDVFKASSCLWECGTISMLWVFPIIRT
ncbi:MAG: hypothetical protein IJY89_03290, partial [Clostridia bacterium]|nr:hypothetical protein [Clostridia bacterium]